MGFQSNAFQQNAFQGVAPAGPGPVQIGPVTIACVATIACAASVKKTARPTASGVATAAVGAKVRRRISGAIAGTATPSARIGTWKTATPAAVGSGSVTCAGTIWRTTSPSVAGLGALSLAFQSGKPVAIAATFAGSALFPDACCIVHRQVVVIFHSPSGSASMSASMQSVARVNLPAMLQSWRATKPEKYKDDARPRKYAGTNGATQSEHPVFPPGTMDAGDPDAYVEAAAAYDEIMHQPVEPEVDIHLLLGRKLLAIQRGRPYIERPATGEKLVRNIEAKLAREADRETRAKMAWVRSFKKK